MFAEVASLIAASALVQDWQNQTLQPSTLAASPQRFSSLDNQVSQ
jgi:hypothetical protein